MLAVAELTKRYSSIPAVSEVSFTVEPGKVLGYLGPNGSGKSTTVKMLTGLLQPSQGHILFRGRDIQQQLIEYKSTLGYVPEDAQLYNYLTGREYLQLVGRLRGLPPKTLDRKVDDFLQLFSLYKSRHSALSSYSKGMRQKILISAALLHNPEVLILDEPESGLDVGSILVLRHNVSVITERGRAILYSSHIVENVERLCTRVVVLGAGRIVIDGNVDSIRTIAPSGSLEEAFATLAAQHPQSVASEIADIVTHHA